MRKDKTTVDDKSFVMLKLRIKVFLETTFKITNFDRNIIIVLNTTTKNIILITKFTLFYQIKVK
jgi:hypothetical protein